MPRQPDPKAFIDAVMRWLRAESKPSDQLVTDPDIVAGYLAEPTGRFGAYEGCLVVRPDDSYDLTSIIDYARRFGFTVVPQGGRTGLVGGGVPTGGGQLIVSTRGMRRRHWLADDPTTRIVVVEAGVTLTELQEFAAERGLWLPLDLGSRDSATVGGLIATDAGGHYTARYGSMGAHVVALTLLRADGQVFFIHQDQQPELLADVIGSEGILGIIVGAQLKLEPLPVRPFTVLVGATSMDNALTVAQYLKRYIPTVMAVEMMTQTALVLAGGNSNKFSSPVYLLIEAEEAGQERLAEIIAAYQADGFLAGDEEVSQTPREAQAHWAIRDGIPGWCNQHPPVLKLDVQIPAKSYVGFYTWLQELVKNPHLIQDAESTPRLVVFGHISGLNFHVNIVGLTAADTTRVEQAILEQVLLLGGEPSHEHGFGVAKPEYLSGARGDRLRACRTLLDPEGVFARGVLLTALPT